MARPERFELPTFWFVAVAARTINNLYTVLRTVNEPTDAACRTPGRASKSGKDEAPLNCVALRPSLDYEVAWRAVKGQDERQKTAPLTALHATGRSVVDVGKKRIRRAATSALTFMTFS
jgi:hypothetical protein